MTTAMRENDKIKQCKGEQFQQWKRQKNLIEAWGQFTLGKCHHINAEGCGEGERYVRIEFSRKQEQPVKGLWHRTCLHSPTTLNWWPAWLESCRGGWCEPRSCGSQSLLFLFLLGGKQEPFILHRMTPWGEREQRWKRGCGHPYPRPWLKSEWAVMMWFSCGNPGDRASHRQCVRCIKFLSPKPTVQETDLCAKRVLRVVGRWWHSRVALNSR